MADDSVEQAPPPTPTSNQYISFGGYLFVGLSLSAFGVAMYLLWKVGMTLGPASAPPLVLYYPEIILCAIGIFSAILGVRLLQAAGAASIPPPGRIMNSNEWNTLAAEVQQGREESITQYVRLRSLTGFTGVFTKLGLQGLPLATIALTLFFSLMYVRDDAYLELAKLTLGAFIGSFVQKQVGERQSGSGTVQLPSGERLTVKSPSPPTSV